MVVVVVFMVVVIQLFKETCKIWTVCKMRCEPFCVKTTLALPNKTHWVGLANVIFVTLIVYTVCVIGESAGPSTSERSYLQLQQDHIANAPTHLVHLISGQV